MTQKVLAITKRTADLCGTQALLYTAGLGLIAATNPALAQNLISALQIKGVIVCRHSWTDEEREAIVAQVATNPGVSVTMRCPGCEGCDESAHRPGSLSDTRELNALIHVIAN